MEASQVQIWRSNANMTSCMSYPRLVRVRISFCTSKIIFDTWRLLEPDLGGQPDTDNGGQTLICLHLCQNIGLLKSGFHKFQTYD